jgi:hypothetical protein
MQCGDMGDEELLMLGLRDISALVDPYRLVRYDFPATPHLDGFWGSSQPVQKYRMKNVLIYYSLK